MGIQEGVLYIGIGEKFQKEAIHSAMSIKEHMPEVNITIRTDSNPENSVFDNVEIVQQRSGIDNKVFNISELPYEKTLFLDTDVYITDSISELFDLLDECDLAVYRKQDYYLRSSYPDSIPDCYPEFNTGVIGFRRSTTRNFLSNWMKNYEENKEEHVHDQVSFRTTLYKSDMKIAPIGTEYNLKLDPHVETNPGHVTQKVKVIHYRPSDVEFGSNKFVERVSDIEKAINSNTDRSRVFIPKGGQLKIVHSSVPHPPFQKKEKGVVSLLINGKKVLKEEGPKYFTKRTARYFRENILT